MSSDFMVFPSPAKLNLFLHITKQRSDGYHELQTLFQFLDHSDTIEIKPVQDGKITLLTEFKDVSPEDNLIIKAANLLKLQALKTTTDNKTLGAQIKINKILPMGGGLGGGSSNAATILIALNYLWKTQFSNDLLAQLGVTLGADVPVFVRGFAAFAQGIGEQLTPANPHEYWYLVTKPNCSISTAAVFQAAELTRNTPKLKLADINIENCHNDCQNVVIKNHPEVAKLLAWLVEYAPSQMTGTGACLFSRFNAKEGALALQNKLPKDVSSFVAKGLNTSPLLKKMTSLNSS